MALKILYLVLSACSLAALGCGGSTSFRFSFGGRWDVRYNLVEDECGIVAGGIDGFTDQHSIDESAENFTLQSSSGLFGPASGQLESEDQAFFESRESGDITGSGIPCSLTVQIGYRLSDSNRAENTFLFDLVCADGFACSSSAIGGAIRQPEL